MKCVLFFQNFSSQHKSFSLKKAQQITEFPNISHEKYHHLPLIPKNSLIVSTKSLFIFINYHSAPQITQVCFSHHFYHLLSSILPENISKPITFWFSESRQSFEVATRKLFMRFHLRHRIKYPFEKYRKAFILIAAPLCKDCWFFAGSRAIWRQIGLFLEQSYVTDPSEI